MYTYLAKVHRVVDGDTVWLEVDLGLRVFHRVPFRLIGIDAPELHEVGGHEAKDRLAELLSGLPEWFTIQTSRPDKYGRWLVTILSVNQRMVDEGHARPYP